MNATRPEWLEIVQRAAETYSVVGLPSLGDELGRGSWKLTCNGHVNADDTSIWVLYWTIGTKSKGRRYVRVGDFVGKPLSIRKSRRRKHYMFQTDLTLGWDEQGRRVMREKESEAVLVVEMDEQGLPKPIPIEKAGSVRITPHYHHA